MKYGIQWLLCKMNRQENSHSTGVSCVPKMKSLMENNGSVLRQIAQRKRRTMRERVFIKGQTKCWKFYNCRHEDQKSNSTYLICCNPLGQVMADLLQPSSPRATAEHSTMRINKMMLHLVHAPHHPIMDTGRTFRTSNPLSIKMVTLIESQRPHKDRMFMVCSWQCTHKM